MHCLARPLLTCLLKARFDETNPTQHRREFVNEKNRINRKVKNDNLHYFSTCNNYTFTDIVDFG